MIRTADNIDVHRVLQRLTGHWPSPDVRIDPLGQGGQAVVFRVAEDRPLVVKLFHTNGDTPYDAMTDEFSALHRLHRAVANVTIDGWTVVAPQPLLCCRHPRAIVMTAETGEPLSRLLRDDADGAWIDEVAGVVFAALQRYWAGPPRLYGDLNLDNILCDPQAKQLTLIDPGMPDEGHLCESAPSRWFPMSRDLAYLAYSVACSVKRNLPHPLVDRRQLAMVEAIVRQGVEHADDPGFVDELRACVQLHVATITGSWSLAGAWRSFVRHRTAARVDAMIERITQQAAMAC